MTRPMVPFAETRRGTVSEYLHAMYSVSAMLLAAEKGAEIATLGEFSRFYPELIEGRDMEMLAKIKLNLKNAANAAALIFMHSAYENAVFDLLKRLVAYDPDAWLSRIAGRKVAFAEVRSKGVSSMEHQLLGQWLEKDVKRASFPNKVTYVLETLKSSTRGVVSGFEWDEETFKGIDDLRHGLTHRANFSRPIEDIGEKLRYLHCTVLLLEKLAEQKYPGHITST